MHCYPIGLQTLAQMKAQAALFEKVKEQTIQQKLAEKDAEPDRKRKKKKKKQGKVGHCKKAPVQ